MGTEAVCVPAPLAWLRSPLPELPTPGGGEMIGVPFCWTGLDAGPCCWLLACVLEWVAAVLETVVELIWTAEVRLEAPFGACPPLEGEGPPSLVPFCPARGMGGRSGFSC